MFSGRYPVTHLFLGRPDFQNAKGNERPYNYPDKIADQIVHIKVSSGKYLHALAEKGYRRGEQYHLFSAFYPRDQRNKKTERYKHKDVADKHSQPPAPYRNPAAEPFYDRGYKTYVADAEYALEPIPPPEENAVVNKQPEIRRQYDKADKPGQIANEYTPQKLGQGADPGSSFFQNTYPYRKEAYTRKTGYRKHLEKVPQNRARAHKPSDLSEHGYHLLKSDPPFIDYRLLFP